MPKIRIAAKSANSPSTKDKEEAGRISWPPPGSPFEKIYISNKGCRNAYTNTKCPCPPKKCWVVDQEQRQNDSPRCEVESMDAWLTRIRRK